MTQPSGQGFSLSPQQRRLWSLLAADRAGACRAACSVALEGALETPRLRAAFARVVRRHEILRTSFHRPAGFDLPLQYVEAGDGEPTVGVCDLSALPAGRREAAAADLLAAVRALSCDPGSEPALRAALVRFGPAEHRLSIVLNALCGDRRTAGLVWQEAAGAYAGAPEEGEALQYADLAEWQNELLMSEETREGREHWRAQAAAALIALERAGTRRSESASRPFLLRALPVPLETEDLAGLATALEASEPEILLALWVAVLWRSQPDPELVLGLFHDGRKFAELQGALGLFAKHLPLAISLDEETGWRELLGRLRRAVERAHALQEHFAWEVMDAADAGSPPVLSAAFEWREEPPAETRIRELRCGVPVLEGASDRFSVLLAARSGPEGPLAEIRYDASQHTAAEAERLALRCATLLAEARRDPHRPLARLSLLSAEERRQILAVLAPEPEDAGAPGEACLHRLVALPAAAFPGRVAVVAPREELTWGELAARSRRLARYLRRRGVGPDLPVGVLMDRSAGLVVALLAILEAGGGYVPLDPAYPVDRLSFMLDDCGAPLVLAAPHLCHLLPPAGGTEVIPLDRAEAAAAGEAEEPVESGAREDHLAYVIYTSGSTGRPKGVMVTHGNAVHSTRARLSTYAAAGAPRFLLLSSHAFDSSVAGIFGTLAAGGTLVLPPEEAQGDPARLLSLLEGAEVDMLLALPGLYTLLLEIDPARLATLRTVIVAGEACPVELVRQHRLLLPRAALYNEYGPTEATVWSTVYDCGRLAEQRQVPIGRVIPGLHLDLVDPRLEPVAWGIPGELVIGGRGVTRGYLGRPELTAERFVPDGGARTPGGRLYRSGDLVRLDRDGDLEFLGRIDQQVKLRGFRIELGEIESQLEQHESVQQAVVLLREDEPGNRRLVAYVVLRPSAVAPGVDGMRSHLLARLPEHMVPAAVVVLDALPRLPNGKVDRSALAALPAPAGRRLAPPRTATEEHLARLWSELLAGAPVGIFDNFFELGGHSLLAAQLVARLAQSFQIELSLRDLLETPTVAGLAARMEEMRRMRPTAAHPALRPLPRPPRPPLSFSQQRLWLVHQLDPDSPAYNSLLAIRLHGGLSPAVLRQTLAAIIDRHEALRTCFPAEEGEPWQEILPHMEMLLPEIDLQGLAAGRRDTEVLRLAHAEGRLPFDLSRVPLLRAMVLRLEEREWVLLLNMHHIISDGWSMGVLKREIAVLYEAFSSGAPSPLPPLSVQFGDYALWQRSWLTGEVLEQQLAFWRRYLEGAPRQLALPTDHPRPLRPSQRGRRRVCALPPGLSAEIRNLCRSEEVTLFMGLTASLVTLLHLYSGQTDIVIGSPMANRHPLETEDLIGFFVNTLALRVRLSGDLPFREVVQRTKRSLLDAFACPDLPVEKLLEELRPERHLSRSPLFQVVFTLQNAPLPAVALSQLRLEVLEIETDTAKFDLTFNFWETPDGLSGSIEHSRDLYEDETVDRMWLHLEHLLESIVENPEAPLGSLRLFSEEEELVLGREFKSVELESDFLFDQ